MSDRASAGPNRTWLRVLLGFVVLYLAIYVVRLVMGVGPNLLLRHFGASADFRAFVGSTLNYGVGIVAYIMFPAIALQKIIGIDAWPRFFPARPGWWKYLLGGILLVGVVLAIFFAIELSLGWLRVDAWTWNSLSGDAWLRVAWVGLLVNVGVAIGEETVFRGYLLTGLKSVWGRWPALVCMTVIFGLFHLPAYLANDNRPAAVGLSIVLASLFGLLFGLVYLRTSTLWLPAALHFAWNFIENDVLNLSADSSNPNLVGALTRLQGPLQADGSGVLTVLVETLAFFVIAGSLALWLRHPRLYETS